MNLNIFNTTNLFEASTSLFQQLGIKLNSNTASPLPVKDLLKHHYKDNDTFKAIDKTYYIGTIDDSVFKATGLFDVKYSVEQAIQQGDKNYEGLMLFALDLKKQPTRTEISELTRAFNRISQKMPVALLLKYPINSEAVISVAISERFKYRQNWRQGEKAGKVIILRDIYTLKIHAGHERILLDLVKPAGISTYEQLHQQWLEVLDVNILNKRFYSELFNWYLWAIRSVNFPNDLDNDKDDMVYNSESVIRLLTRLIFVWFIKEKNLVPSSLFDLKKLQEILKDFNPESEESSVYYRAILQNLFFATLNTPMDKDITAENKDEQRRFINTLPRTGNDQYLDQTKYRYQNYFTKPDKALELFATIPFLNGGLFECLDFKEGSKEIRFDGFSSTKGRQAFAPDKLFFAKEFVFDLNSDYGTKGKNYKVKGLIKILDGYKFTITENTPLEEEIALDPELLGKVFENLLASYNPETQTTARKQTGSFYTPREIVNYMVDESLIACFKQQLAPEDETFETKLRDLFSQETDLPEFTKTETDNFIKSISEVKILDPACGSGAFPMGILHRLVDLLNKLDPENKNWNELQKQRAIAETADVFNSGDVTEREIRLNEINKAFDLSMNYPDYARKLFLIENCIYGVDIHQIAIQISKLRFFISLIVDQKVNDNKPNRNILSMPNLETKFVAANTLIGLDKPQQMTLMAGDVEKLEKDLASIRHKIFFTRKYSAKKALKKQEKTKREELQKALEQTGYTKNVATQMAGWNPFDPMQSAKFFDPETMFGFNSGFDVVIGNPPYVSAMELKKSMSKSEYIILKQDYITAKGTVDLFIYFFEKGIKLLKQKGQLAFITPNRYLSASYGEALREFLFKQTRVNEIIDYSHVRVFEEASIYPVVSLLTADKSENKSYEISIGKYNEVSSKIDFKIVNSEKLNFLEGYIWGYLLNDKMKITEHVISNSVPINECAIINATSTASEADEYHDLINEKKGLKLINTGTIDRYEVLWGIEKLTDKGKKYLTPYLPKDDNRISKNRNNLYKSSKIILAKIAITTEAFYDAKGEYASVNTNCFHTFKNDFNPKYILAWLNCKLFQYAFECFFEGLKMQGGYLLYSSPNVSKMFIKKLSTQEQIPIITLVDQILSAKAANPKADTSALERQIDEMVYKLYDLTEEEIAIIEGDSHGK